MMNKALTFVFVLGLLITGAHPYLSQSNRRQDIRARAQARAQAERRDRIQEELKAAVEELATLTEALTEEVAKADGYTVSLQILESSERIEELAQEIEEIARTINRRAQGR
jgi:hypothetical protein